VTGLFFGTLIGGLLGLTAGLLWGFVGQGPLGATGRALIAFVPFLIAGAITGAIVGAAVKPREAVGPVRELDDPVLAGERDTIVAVHVSDPDTAERAQHVLEELGAERVDAITADGTPLPPTRHTPRKPGGPNRGWFPGDGGR
jgi:outer membrane lipoprotein SlyB